MPGDPLFTFLSETDRTGPVYQCYRVKDLADVTKFSYYALRLFKALRGVPLPPP